MATLKSTDKVCRIIERDGFRDAIYLSKAEFDSIPDALLTAIEDARFSKFEDAIRNPPAPVEPTKADLTFEAELLQEKLDAIYAKEPALKLARIEELTGVKK